MTFGLTDQGFVPMSNDDLETAMDGDLRAAFGQSIDTTGTSVFGQMKSIMAERLAMLWQACANVYASQDPDKATGQAQDAVCALTGTVREKSRQSTVTLTLTGTPATLVPAGKVANVASVGTPFVTQADATITLLTSWAAGPHSTGDRVTAGGNCYICTVPGNDATYPGPSGTTSPQTVGGVTWVWMGQGTGAVDVAAKSQNTGPWVAVAYTINIIATPVGGWNGVTNLNDALVGANVEQDPDLRVRREDELEEGGEATLLAIQSKVSKVGQGTNNPVTTCIVFQNATMYVDAFGRPPKSVEVLVQGGADADIYQTVLDSVAGGIQSWGTNTTTIPDAMSNMQTVAFSRPSLLLVYVTVNVEVDPSTFPVTGAQQIQDAIGLLIYPIAKGVAAEALKPAVWTVPGVINITSLYIGLAPSPASSATIPAGSHDRAMFDTSRIVVNVTSGSPADP